LKLLFFYEWKPPPVDCFGGKVIWDESGCSSSDDIVSDESVSFSSFSDEMILLLKMRTKQMNSAAYPFILNTKLFAYIRIETEINNIILPVFFYRGSSGIFFPDLAKYKISPQYLP